MFKKITAPFLKAFREPEVEVFVNPDWGSQAAEHRQKIRDAIEFQLKTHWQKEVAAGELEHLHDLNRYPVFKKIHVSISHCLEMGGFVLSKMPVGFDIELVERVQQKIVARVSKEAEMINAPSLAHLWAAKEAAFKALHSFRQPDVISELQIGAWDENMFRLLNSEKYADQEGYGIAWVDGSFVFSIFHF
jgi:phosphopantetheinyl transferase (holo-ACP synthase)